MISSVDVVWASVDAVVASVRDSSVALVAFAAFGFDFADCLGFFVLGFEALDFSAFFDAEAADEDGLEDDDESPLPQPAIRKTRHSAIKNKGSFFTLSTLPFYTNKLYIIRDFLSIKTVILLNEKISVSGKFFLADICRKILIYKGFCDKIYFVCVCVIHIQRKVSMKDYGLGQFNNIDAFVEAKLSDFKNMERSLFTLFELMFREKDNKMFEKSEGYRIRSVTYGESRSNILKRAAVLKKSLGDLERGSVVGLAMDNSLDWIEIFWAIILAGYNPLLINLRLSGELASKAIKDADAKAVISDGKTYSVRTISSDEIKPDGSELKISSDATGSEILVMSSGTSASVKICAYTAEEFYYQIFDSYSIIKECKMLKKHYNGRLKQLTFLPFYHIFGLVAVYIWFAFFSRTFVQLNDMAPQTIVNTVKRHKVTHIFAVPLFWETVYKEALRTIKNRGEKTVKKFEKGMNLARKTSGIPVIGSAFSKLAFKEVRENLFGDSISYLITGGSNISTETLEFFNAIGYRISNGYGMSEIGITSVELSSDKRVLNSGSVGKPMSFTEYKINEKGELLVKGKGIARYIIENGVKNEKPEWFNTHDLAVCENGRYKILGRKDDLIISSSGENINPNLVEPVYDIIEKTNGVCLIGVKENGADAPVLIVSVNRYITADNLAVIEKKVKGITEMLNLSGEIKKIVFTSDSLLQGEEFKLNRLRIKNDYLSGKLTTVEPTDSSDEAENDSLMIHLIQVISLTLARDAEEISPRSDFFLDLGGSSLDYLAMTAKLQEEFGIAFPTSSGQSLSTAKDLYKFIKEH